MLLAGFGIRYYYVKNSRENQNDLWVGIRAVSLPSPYKDDASIGGFLHNNCGTSAGEYRLHGAKTLYDEVREKMVEEVKIPGCVPKQFWLLSRHGARYPGPWEMHSLISKLPHLKTSIQNTKIGRGSLTTNDIDSLLNWEMKFNQDLDNHLTPWGEIEMKELAQRFKRRFPSLLGFHFSSDIYNFRHTDSARTADSARHFATGLFGSTGVVSIPEPVKDDPVIKFYKTCRKWKEEVDDNEEARKEQQRFRDGPEMKKVVRDVSSRLGFKENLSFEDIHLMFSMCRYESAVRPNQTSPWCNFFNRNEKVVMEYDEDLDYYWIDGYGFSINYEQACPPVKDFLDHFRAAMQPNSTAPLGVFHFSHSGLLLKVYARLGLFRDATPPTADNFKQQTSRLWRSSLIDPFTANLALVLFQCTDGYKILAYVQEREVVLPGCDNILCPMETVLRNYAPLADPCDISEICDGFLENYAYCRRRRRKKHAPILQNQSQKDILPPTNSTSNTCTLKS